MIFVTVGSQKFQFDRLLKKIDECIEKGIITEEVYAQIGYSSYEPRNYSFVQFTDRDTFAEKLNSCDIVVTHGGTGVIINAVKGGKKVLAVPRLARYGEHVDDHQLQLLHQFDELGIILACYSLEEFEEKFNELSSFVGKEYKSNTDAIIESIEEFLGTLK